MSFSAQCPMLYLLYMRVRPQQLVVYSHFEFISNWRLCGCDIDFYAQHKRIFQLASDRHLNSVSNRDSLLKENGRIVQMYHTNTRSTVALWPTDTMPTLETGALLCPCLQFTHFLQNSSLSKYIL